jgi:ribulose-5-phosphate 4-epimerase/fuculose-1-phosphate aldolase
MDAARPYNDLEEKDAMGPPLRVRFDAGVARQLVRYAHRLAARGYVHNSLGNIAVRVHHPRLEHGVVYTKHAEISLEDMTTANVVVTDVPTGRLLHGTTPTSVGHQLNREILRLRPDVNAVIHVHHDETIALFASGGFTALPVVSIEFPVVMGLPPHVLPSHLDVELDVAPIKTFIDRTNAIVMEHHGVSVLGRTLAEAYYRLNTLTAEVRRVIQAEQLAAARGSRARYLDPAGVDELYENADRVIYPSRFVVGAAAGAPTR